MLPALLPVPDAQDISSMPRAVIKLPPGFDHSHFDVCRFQCPFKCFVQWHFRRGW